ncbi:MAG TPA: DUF1015 domain-containing protein [Clostridia bacterium]|nr:DUF1015 domain-containing protein [Clostridia bacterium]
MIKIPKILLPNKNINMTKWSTIACDQYTSELEYWKSVESEVENEPSTYHLMLPEIYLEEEDVDERIEKINKTMDKYISDGIFEEKGPCIIVVERSFPNAPTRTGMMLTLDLEDYDFHKDSTSLIRATEGTVEERIPPRMKIRENASIEMPHIMVLIDDPEKTVLEPLKEYAVNNLVPIYDFELMKDGGHIKGYEITDNEIIEKMKSSILRLADKEVFKNKYNTDVDVSPMLFAVGDGNHSLASAKCHWDNIKKGLSEEEKANHPARFALCEIVNIHDQGIVFEPIHRVLFNVDTGYLFDELQGYFMEDATIVNLPDDFDESKVEKQEGVHTILFVTENEKGIIYIDEKVHTLATGALQPFLDKFLEYNKDVKIDYIHGLDSLKQLGTRKGNIGFIFPNLDKRDFFTSIVKNGPMPRKTFSLGEANEKRYYLECRKIK